MKKAFIGVVAIGGFIALRPLLGRVGHRMSEHCEQMASRCGQVMASQRCGAYQEAPDHSDAEAPEFIDHREPVGTA